jgi:hypothetical protein
MLSGTHVQMLPSFLANPIKTVLLATMVYVSLPGAVQAQDSTRAETVSWSVSAPQVLKTRRVALTIRGAVREGWHVYSLKQVDDGPTPLLVSVERNNVAQAAGAVTGSTPVKQRDAAFGFDTQFYAKPFTLTVPVRLKAGTKPGPQTIPLSVRFQTCNGAVCQPPKTVHLTATVDLKAAW